MPELKSFVAGCRGCPEDVGNGVAGDGVAEAEGAGRGAAREELRAQTSHAGPQRGRAPAETRNLPYLSAVLAKGLRLSYGISHAEFDGPGILGYGRAIFSKDHAGFVEELGHRFDGLLDGAIPNNDSKPYKTVIASANTQIL